VNSCAGTQLEMKDIKINCLGCYELRFLDAQGKVVHQSATPITKDFPILGSLVEYADEVKESLSSVFKKNSHAD